MNIFYVDKDPITAPVIEYKTVLNTMIKQKMVEELKGGNTLILI